MHILCAKYILCRLFFYVSICLTRLHTIKIFFSIILFNFLFFSQAFAQEGKLVFALDLIRHGDRTPIGTIPKAPHSWAEGMGQLTATGMQREFQIGTALRKKYIQDNKFLPVNYNADSIYVRSTDVDRTLMSAYSLLVGLYPLGTGPILPSSDQPALPSALQPIPIHTVPIAEDIEFIPPLDQKKWNDLLAKYVFPRTDWKEKTAELQPNFARWGQETGIAINNIYQLQELGDTLHIYEDNNIPLPEGMTEEDANKIIKSGEWVFTTIFKPQEVGQATGKQVLQRVSNYLQQVSDQKSALKFVLLSAHDITIVSAMSALHIPLSALPPYASDLNFSLYELSSKNYIVKVSYNDQVVEIPGCDGSSCTLSQFESLVNN